MTSNIHKYITFLLPSQLMARWQLVPIEAIELLKKEHPIDFYSTIENYDKNGQKLSCPIYMDFDGSGAWEGTCAALNSFEEIYDYVESKMMAKDDVDELIKVIEDFNNCQAIKKKADDVKQAVEEIEEIKKKELIGITQESQLTQQV
jgi:hypothetical protein